jgi:hypothetical protein
MDYRIAGNTIASERYQRAEPGSHERSGKGSSNKKPTTKSPFLVTGSASAGGPGHDLRSCCVYMISNRSKEPSEIVAPHRTQEFLDVFLVDVGNAYILDVHFDIKPDNILLSDRGEALMTEPSKPKVKQLNQD